MGVASKLIGRGTEPNIKDPHSEQEELNFRILAGRNSKGAKLERRILIKVGAVKDGFTDDYLLKMLDRGHFWLPGKRTNFLDGLDAAIGGHYFNKVKELAKEHPGLVYNELYINAVVGLAEAHYQRGRYKAAKEVLNTVVGNVDGKNPLDINSPAYHILYAKIVREDGNIEEAVLHLRKAAEILYDGKNWLKLGITEERKKELEAELFTHLGGAHRVLGDAKGNAEQYSANLNDVIFAYEQAWGLNEKDIQINNALAIAYNNRLREIRDKVQRESVVEISKQMASAEKADDEKKLSVGAVQAGTLESYITGLRLQKPEENEQTKKAKEFVDEGIKIGSNNGFDNQREAILKFREAIKADSNYALAYDKLVQYHTHIANVMMNGLPSK